MDKKGSVGKFLILIILIIGILSIYGLYSYQRAWDDTFEALDNIREEYRKIRSCEDNCLEQGLVYEKLTDDDSCYCAIPKENITKIYGGSP